MYAVDDGYSRNFWNSISVPVVGCQHLSGLVEEITKCAGMLIISTFYRTFSFYTFVFNPSLADYDMLCLSNQCRSRSVGF